MFDRACKPGSVRLSRGNHLSSPRVAPRLEPCGSATMKSASSRSEYSEDQGVASDRVYSKSALPQKWVSSYLAFPSLPYRVRRFISVALSRGSPRADVIRYPALRCPDFPHRNTFRQHTARLPHSVTNIIPETALFVKSARQNLQNQQKAACN